LSKESRLVAAWTLESFSGSIEPAVKSSSLTKLTTVSSGRFRSSLAFVAAGVSVGCMAWVNRRLRDGRRLCVRSPNFVHRLHGRGPPHLHELRRVHRRRSSIAPATRRATSASTRRCHRLPIIASAAIQRTCRARASATLRPKRRLWIGFLSDSSTAR